MIDLVDHVTREMRMSRRKQEQKEMYKDIAWFVGVVLVSAIFAYLFMIVMPD